MTTLTGYSANIINSLLLIHIFGNSCLTHYNYVSYNLSWSSAEIFCKSHYNGSLAAFSEDLRGIIPTNTTIWVGDFKIATPWMYYKGCKNVTTIQSRALATYNHTLENGPAICQRKCNGRTLFAIMGQYCFCLPDHMQLMVDNTSTHCNIVCPSPYENFACGGEDDYASIYSLVNVTTTSAKITQNCVTMKCNGTKHLLYADDCNDTFPFVCLNLDFHNDTKTWYNSSASCSVLHNSVLQVIFETHNVCDERYIHNKKYWIGLFRDTLKINALDEDFKNVQTCYYATKTDGDVMTQETRNCESKRFPFVCKSGKTWTTNVTESIEMLPSSTSDMKTGLLAGLLSVFLLLSLSIFLLILWKRGYLSSRCQKQRSSSVTSWSTYAQNPLYPFKWLRKLGSDKIEPKTSEIREQTNNTISDGDSGPVEISSVGGYHDMSVKRKNDSYEDEYTEMNCLGLEDDNNAELQGYTNERDQEYADPVSTFDECSKLPTGFVTPNGLYKTSAYMDEREEEYAVPVEQDSSEYSVIPETDVGNLGMSSSDSLVNSLITERDEEYANPEEEDVDYDDIFDCQESNNTVGKCIVEMDSLKINGKDKAINIKQNSQRCFDEVREDSNVVSDDENIYEEYENTSQLKKS